MKLLKLTLLILTCVICTAGSAFATSTFDVTVNTSAVTGETGYLYLQYDPLNAVSSTATVFYFSTNGTLGATAPGAFTGSGSANSEYYVTGTLPNTVVFANTNAVNDYNQAITFGATLSFSVALSDPAAGGGGVSTFSLGIFQDALGNTPLYNVNDPNVPGTVVELNLANNGTVSESILDPQDVTVPIPPTVLLFGAGLLGMLGIRRNVKI